MSFAPSPEEVLLQEMETAAEDLMLARLTETLAQLSPVQARRSHVRYELKRKFREIAAADGMRKLCRYLHYRICKPLIVTTNMKLNDLKNLPDLAHARIYGRILERCAPSFLFF